MPNVRFTFFRDPQDRKVFPGCFFPTLSILSGCYTWHFSEKSPRWEVRTTRRSVDPQNPIPPLTRSDRTGGWSSGGRCFLAEGLGPCQGIYCTFQLNPIESKNWRFPTKNQGLTPLTHPCFFFPILKPSSDYGVATEFRCIWAIWAWQPRFQKQTGKVRLQTSVPGYPVVIHRP